MDEKEKEFLNKFTEDNPYEGQYDFHKIPSTGILKKINFYPVIGSRNITQRMFEQSIAKNNYAVRFCYMDGVLLGYDVRDSGQGWNYPKYMYDVIRLLKAYGNYFKITEVFYYEPQKCFNEQPLVFTDEYVNNLRRE